MAKKKRPARRQPSEAEEGQDAPDELGRSGLRLEDVIRSLLASRASSRLSVAEVRALRLVAKASGSSGAERDRLIHQALGIAPRCALAWMVLGEDAVDPREALACFQQAKKAAEEDLGPESSSGPSPAPEDSPRILTCLRAYAGVAASLWALGEKEAALEEYRAVLRLDPSDALRLRYELAAHLASLGRQEEFAELLDRYDDASADWLYNRVLRAFQREGDSSGALNALRAAMRKNASVPALLVGDVPLPEKCEPAVRPGGQEEAAAYANALLSGWRNTHGAISWLRRAAGVGLPKGQPESRSGIEPDELRRLPQADGEVWQADWVHLSRPRASGGPRTQRMWAILVTCAAKETVLAFELSPVRPSDRQLWDCLVEAMTGPLDGKPHRPIQVEFGAATRVRKYGAVLARIGVGCTHRKPLDDLQRMASQLERALPPCDRADGDPAAPDAEDLLALPQAEEETWEIDVFQMATWVDAEQGPVRPWVTLVASTDSGAVVGHHVSLAQPSFEEIQALLVESAWNPMIGPPHRPATAAFRSEDHRHAMEGFLQAAEIRCLVSDRLDAVDRARAGLTTRMGDSGAPALIEAPELTPQDVGDFYEAAGGFYQRAPWRDVEGDTVIRIQCETLPGGPWYAIVMGQIGIVVGLAVYNDYAFLQRVLSGQVAPKEHARCGASLSVMFDEEFGIAAADLEAAEQFGWPVVAPEAYPTAIHVGRGRALRAPALWEIRLLQGILRAIPEYLVSPNRSLRAMVAPTSRGELRFQVDVLR